MKLALKTFYLFLFTIVFFSCKTNDSKSTQSNFTSKDSSLLVKLIDSLSHHYKSSNDSLILESNKIYSHFSGKKAYISIKLAYLHYSQANYLLAEHYFNKAATTYKKQNLSEKQAEQLANIGVIKEISGSYTSAIKTYIKALAIFDSLNLELKSSMIHNNIGVVYQQLHENEKALESYRASLKITQKLNKKSLSASRYNNIASVYEELDYNLDSSLFYYQKAKKIWANDSVSENLAIVENNIGAIYLRKGNFKIADSLFRKAYRFSKENNQKNNISKILRNQAQLATTQGNLTEGITKAKEAIKLAQENSNKEVESESLEVLISALEQSKQFEKANQNLKKYYSLRDELSGIEQKKQINQLAIQYQVKEKENKIKILTLEQNDLNQKLWLQFLAISILIILLSALYIVYKLQKRNNDLKIQEMRRVISDYISKLEEIKEEKAQNTKLSKEEALKKLKKFGLTEREESILLLITEGFTNAEIAEKVFVSINTVKTHIKNIFIKLNVRNRTEAAKKIEKV